MSHLLFAGHDFYPRGGISDLVARGTVEYLMDYFQTNAKEIAGFAGYVDNWGQIVNAETLECVMWGTLECESGTAVWQQCDSNAEIV